MNAPKIHIAFVVLALIAGFYIGSSFRFPGAVKKAVELGNEFNQEVDRKELMSWAGKYGQRNFPDGRVEIEIDQKEWPPSVRTYFGDDLVSCYASLSLEGECIGIYFRKGISAIVIPIQGLPREQYFSLHRIGYDDDFYAASLYR